LAARPPVPGRRLALLRAPPVVGAASVNKCSGITSFGQHAGTTRYHYLPRPLEPTRTTHTFISWGFHIIPSIP
jgi:hypothetical protein